MMRTMPVRGMRFVIGVVTAAAVTFAVVTLNAGATESRPILLVIPPTPAAAAIEIPSQIGISTAPQGLPTELLATPLQPRARSVETVGRFVDHPQATVPPQAAVPQAAVPPQAVVPPQAAVPPLNSSGWSGQRIQVPALGIDLPLSMAGDAAVEDFPPFSGAHILRSSSQPGRGTNSYIFAHAMPELFKPLWGAQIGQKVIVTMSDGQQLHYRITRIVPNVPCPDPAAPKPAGLPPVLANATECDLSWTLPTPTERLTLQTSQGFNRNYGEFIVIAEPAP
ncbi:hypothetical protein BH24CHL10_BH24CHL10_00950 [soil metagenome]